MSSLKEHLVAIRDLRAGHGPKDTKYSSIEDFVLKNGKSYKFKKLPKKYRRGRGKECFMNATQLSQSHSELTYTEGYAFNMIPTMHAWVVDKEGNAYDPTWEKGFEYFGVEFSGQYLSKTLLKKGTYGLIENMEMGFPLLTGKDTDFNPSDLTGDEK